MTLALQHGGQFARRHAHRQFCARKEGAHPGPVL